MPIDAPIATAVVRANPSNTAVTNPALSMALATDAAASNGFYTAEEPAGPHLPARLLLRDSRSDAPAGVSFGIAPAPAATAQFGALANIPEEMNVSPLGFSLSAATTFNLDVTVAHRGLAQDGPSGAIVGRGAEVRVGQRISDRLGFHERGQAERPSWYLFASSDGRALTWTPATDPASPTSAVQLQRQVEVGDVQAGVGMEVRGVQASLSYVKRDVKTQIGPWRRSFDDSFAGVTLSMRR